MPKNISSIKTEIAELCKAVQSNRRIVDSHYTAAFPVKIPVDWNLRTLNSHRLKKTFTIFIKSIPIIGPLSKSIKERITKK